MELIVGANARQYFRTRNASGGMMGGVMMAGGYAVAVADDGEYQNRPGRM